MKTPKSATSEDDEIFLDRSYWDRVHETARKVAWNGYTKRAIPDLALRLKIVRTVLHLSDDTWTDRDFAQAIFGEIYGDKEKRDLRLRSEDIAPQKFNKFKQGKTNLDEVEASMIACLINYFLDNPARPNRRPTSDEKLAISKWVEESVHDDPNRIKATDISGDIFTFTKKLIHLIPSGYSLYDGGIDGSMEGAVHDLLMDSLYKPIDVSNWNNRLIIQHPRQMHYAEPNIRFGSEQRVGTNPRLWQPVDLDAGKTIEYGIAGRSAIPVKGWLVTVRDPWPKLDGIRDSSGTWVWQAGWENVIRWTISPFLIEANQELAAPYDPKNKLLKIRGLFRAFLFVEPYHSSEICQGLGLSDEHSTPDETNYFRLLDTMKIWGEEKNVSVYTGSYLVS